MIHHRKYQSAKPQAAPHIEAPLPNVSGGSPEIVSIVASTGGPGALGEIVSLLPADFPVPIVVVQHITPDFLPSMIKWLDMVSLLNVSVAKDGDVPQLGNVYLAPGNAHLSLDRRHSFRLEEGIQARYTPSGDILLKSVAQHFGANAVGVVLTGMGDDGAEGLQAMRQAGAYTVAQDEATSAVFGMPRAAIDAGGAQQVLPLADIPATLVEIASYREKST